MNIDSIVFSEAEPYSAEMSIVAKWLSDNWGVDMGYNLSETEAWCNKLANECTETLIVGKYKNHVVGTAIVCECDLEGHEHLTPWMSSLFVPGNYRGIGIGGLLIDTACKWAEERQFLELYLYVEEGRLIPYYRRFGWEITEVVRIDGSKSSIMRKLLAENFE